MNLKPCPFCGGKAETFPGSSIDLGVGYGDHSPGIGCPVCHFAVYRKTQHEAAAVWNTRAEDSALKTGELRIFQCEHCGTVFDKDTEVVEAVAGASGEVAPYPGQCGPVTERILTVIDEDGTDAQALEGALSQVERELASAKAENTVKDKALRELIEMERLEELTDPDKGMTDMGRESVWANAKAAILTEPDLGFRMEDIAAALATLVDGQIVEAIDALRDALRAYGLEPPVGDLTRTQAILEKRIDALSYRVCLLEGPVETTVTTWTTQKGE